MERMCLVQRLNAVRPAPKFHVSSQLKSLQQQTIVPLHRGRGSIRTASNDKVHVFSLCIENCVAIIVYMIVLHLFQTKVQCINTVQAIAVPRRKTSFMIEGLICIISND